MSKMVCAACGEEAVKGRPLRDLSATHKIDPARMRYRHKDGEPLCPEMTSQGYQPCLPEKG